MPAFTALHRRIVACALALATSTGAAQSDRAQFEQRLEKAGLRFALPAGFVDAGPQKVLTNKLNTMFDAAEPFIVWDIRRKSGGIAAYIDARALGVDLDASKLRAAYPIMFEANARSYCALVSGGSCEVVGALPQDVLVKRYHAEYGMVLQAAPADPALLGGHRIATVVAIAKPSRGLVYLTLAYDAPGDFAKHLASLLYLVTFR